MTAKAEPVTLTVKGMSCGGCVSAVRRVVERKDPAAKVEIDLSSGRLTGTATVAARDLAAAITAAGYPATPG